MAHVIAVPIGDKTLAHSQAFLAAQASGSHAAAEALISRVDGMTEDMLQLFLIQPTKFVTLSGGQQRIIDFAVSTASKASHMLTRQIFKKCTAQELAPLAELMKSQTWEADAANDNKTRICVEIDAKLVQDFAQAKAFCESGEAKAHIDLLTGVMDTLTEEILSNFFVAPTDHVKMGFITKKALHVGVDGSHKALRAVTNKVMRELDEPALIAFFHHFGQVILERPE